MKTPMFAKYVLLAALLVTLLVLAPTFVVSLFTGLCVLVLWMATQPVLWAFALGALAHRLRVWRP